MPAKILVVDDEVAVVKSVQMALEKEGYIVVTAMDGPAAIEAVRKEKPNLILLDIVLPTMDGCEVCRTIRPETPVPILMLTGKTDEIDKVVGLEMGADEYLTKPFSLRELTARVKAMLRLVNRYSAPKKEELERIEIGDLVIDLVRHEVTLSGQVLSLTLKEYELLKLLTLNANKVMSREYLIEQVWGYDFTGEGRTVDVHIHWLREKIERDPNQPLRIQTVRGVGYRFERRNRPVVAEGQVATSVIPSEKTEVASD
jgi:two-component system, OmpR family, alkaline phosphatase synthesis response regulator PhoP